MRSVDVLVIGAGASGMTAAIMAGRQGNRVCVVEKKKQPGKKILATGNGRCNFTNEIQQPSCYRSEEAAIAWDILSKFTWKDTIEWFYEIGILAKSKDGYIYPASNQATSIRNALERTARESGVQIRCEETVLDMEVHTAYKTAQQDGYVVYTSKDTYLAKKVIVASGGLASPVHGSTGDGYALAKKIGHHMADTVPALTSLMVEGIDTKEWAGTRVNGTVTLRGEDGVVLSRDTGELQLTASGISGIPVFQVSRFAAIKLKKKETVFLEADCMPEYTNTQLTEMLHCIRKRSAALRMGELLQGLLPDRLCNALLKKCGISPEAEAAGVSEKQIDYLASVIKKLSLQVTGTGNYEKAQVTAGGILLHEVHPDTMESVFAPGVYLVGEILDVDGMCGGYNLQWAWTSGYLAGKACQKKGKK